MLNVAKRSAQQLLRRFNISVVSAEYLDGVLASRNQTRSDIEFVLRLPEPHAWQLLKHLPHSHAQLRQDLFVLSELNFKTNGFFVEFGATDGLELSNTYLLESMFGWTGILAEPARSWHERLRAARHCHIDTNCVWRDSDTTLRFTETTSAEYSSIESYKDSDRHQELRNRGSLAYDVPTVSLMDLLERYEAPRVIDYLSIDTEGSEFEILNRFDFGKYEFRVITCEHNHTSRRDDIFALLTRYGYTRQYQDLSDFDDWYVKRG
jgi:FkbM family methyltransferase